MRELIQKLRKSVKGPAWGKTGYHEEKTQRCISKCKKMVIKRAFRGRGGASKITLGGGGW